MPLRDTINRPMQTRPCAVAGRFYPSDPEALRHDLRKYLGQSPTSPPTQVDFTASTVRAIIAPHAGYIYSAPIAASAYRCLEHVKQRVRRVVLIGPAHYVAFSGLGCCGAAAFETPLGDIPVDTAAVDALLKADQVHIQDPAHAPEHGLEVHLPFLLETLRREADPGANFTIVPLLFGDVSYEVTAGLLDPFFDDPQTLIVVSSDLSHYHDYKSAKRIDRETADAILAGRIEAVTSDRACGHTAIRAVMRIAEQRGMTATELDLRNSGDTAGPRDRVVGYGAFVFF